MILTGLLAIILFFKVAGEENNENKRNCLTNCFAVSIAAYTVLYVLSCIR